MRDAEGFLRWAVAQAPHAAGYWPAQAVATYAIGGVPAIDTAMTASLGALHSWGKWDETYLSAAGVGVSQMPEVVPMGQSAGTIPGTGTHLTGGTVDAFAIRSSRALPTSATSSSSWARRSSSGSSPTSGSRCRAYGLFRTPCPDRILIGGPSNAGALCSSTGQGECWRDFAGTALSRSELEAGIRRNVPVWLPYLRGERTPFHDPDLRSSLHDLDITSTPGGIERAAYEASGFVVRRMLDMAGSDAAKDRGEWWREQGAPLGCGYRGCNWSSRGHCRSVGRSGTRCLLPGPDGRRAREASSREQSDGRRSGRRIEPDPVWVAAAAKRYTRFSDCLPFDPAAPVPKES